MRGLFLTTVFTFLIFQGFSAPFVAALAYIWVDIVKPQELAYSIIVGMPLAFIAAVSAVALYFFNDRKYPPKFTGVMLLLCIFAGWITLTTAVSNELLQIFSWKKWDWAFKVLIFTVFIPYVFRSRVQIEALILVIVLSVATLFFSAGVKTALGSGGYGVLALMGARNTGLAEGSTLATVCVMLIPLMLFVLAHSVIFPANKYFKIFIAGLMAIAMLTVIGTTARTGLIASVVLLLLYFLRSQKKMLWIVSVAMAAGIMLVSDVSSSVWGSRMSTINSYDQDGSALGRIAVWKWTIGFAAEHPMGGGFDAYKLNGISTVTENGILYYEPGVMAGKAFHNIYFEVLGEQGIPGLLIYLLIMFITLIQLWKIRKQCSDVAELEWAVKLAQALSDAIIVFLVAGMFIGIAYQPFVFYMIAMSIALQQYTERRRHLKNIE